MPIGFPRVGTALLSFGAGPDRASGTCAGGRPVGHADGRAAVRAVGHAVGRVVVRAVGRQEYGRQEYGREECGREAPR